MQRCSKTAFSLCRISNLLGLKKAPRDTAAFYAFKPRCILCFLNLYLSFEDRFQFKCFKLHCIMFSSFSSYQEIEKNEHKRKASAAVLSSHLKQKVFHMDSLRWPQVTWVFQMQEGKPATAFLPQSTVDNFLCVSSETSVTSCEAYSKTPHSCWWETWWPEKGNTIDWYLAKP